MNQPQMAQQIGQAAIGFEEQRLDRKPTFVTVLLGGDTLVITMHGVLSRAERMLAATASGVATLQAFHQELFQVCSGALKREIERITGLEVCQADNHETTTAVKVRQNGTVVQMFVLAGQLPVESWSGM